MIQNLATQEMLQSLKEQIMKEQFDEKYPVGSGHYIQFHGMPEPSVAFAKYGATWTRDNDYTGRVLVGSGVGYPLGAMGGNQTQTHGLIGSAKIGLGNDYLGMRANNRGETFQTESVIGVTIVPSYRDGVAGVDVAGTTSEESIMQPYKVVGVWKRTA